MNQRKRNRYGYFEYIYSLQQNVLPFRRTHYTIYNNKVINSSPKNDKIYYFGQITKFGDLKNLQ